jgi:hypothetical protein
MARVFGCDRSILGHVWAYDFVEARTHDGRKFRILTIIDEASRECLALVVARQLRHEDVLAALAELFVDRGPPAHVRSDDGSESIATAVRKWLGQIGYNRRPGSHGGKPSLAVDNTLDRQFDVAAPDRAWVTDISLMASCRCALKTSSSVAHRVAKVQVSASVRGKPRMAAADTLPNQSRLVSGGRLIAPPLAGTATSGRRRARCPTPALHPSPGKDSGRRPLHRQQQDQCDQQE